MLAIIQKLKHIVRTTFGDSELLFGGTVSSELAQIYGVDQGNGAGAVLWAVISSDLFDYIRDKHCEIS